VLIGVIVSAMTKADEYRTRAIAATKTAKRRRAKGDRTGLEKKAKALTAMADNEDWLAGETKPKLKAP
jgi:hypothetical protein